MTRVLALALCGWLLGCASVPTTGMLTERPAPKAMRALAVDAAHQLGLLYPPAHTGLGFTHPIEDVFGRALNTELRTLGFAVADTTVRGSQLSLTYVVDDVASLYRVLLRVSSPHRTLTLARAYTFRGKSLRAASAWTQGVGP